LPEAEISLGTLIDNRYRIQRVLGQGSFGRTYLAADDRRFGELCVLKEFVPSSSAAEYTLQKSRVLFEREAKVLHQIDHPQIPKFLAWFTHQNRLFLVQEYIDGKTYAEILGERLSQQGELFSEAEVIQWLKDLLPVLEYLHERNIIHRDISLDNVMQPHAQSQPVLIDFGLVKQKVTEWAVNSDNFSISDQPTFVGKFGYAPVEQIYQGQCYPCSDLYALAVAAIVLLTGKEPNLLINLATLEWQWHEYVKVSEHLSRTLDKMLLKQPQERYQSAQEVLAELNALAPLEAIAGSTPHMELQIEIDYAKRNQQVAEILEMEYFQQLQQQAKSLRKSFETDSVFQLEAQVPQPSALLAETGGNSPAGTVNSEIQLEAAKLPKLNPAFIDLCWQELACRIGPVARYIVKNTLSQHLDISPMQLVEALAAKITNSQQAQEFKNSVTTNPAFELETETFQRSISSREKIVSWSVEPPVLRLIHCSGREFYLQGQEGYIGRQGQVSSTTPKIDLKGIPHEEIVSRTHARIYWNSSQKAYMLADNNSRNGTYLNGDRLRPGVNYRLNHGDSLQLGSSNRVCFTVAIT